MQSETRETARPFHSDKYVDAAAKWELVIDRELLTTAVNAIGQSP